MAQVSLPVVHRHFGQTSRRDLWWVQPLLIFLGLSIFIIYSTWAAFQGRYYSYGPYLSPFYSPEIFGNTPHAWIHARTALGNDTHYPPGSAAPLPPEGWPGWLPFSPALFILWAPGLFRLTCYYYRGAYYKAFWWDPPNCAVGEPRKSYWGERFFPLLVQNVHRYFMYLALLFLIILAADVWQATRFPIGDPKEGQEGFGIGLGTVILAVNVVLLSGYTLGCHSLRHLVGGGLRQILRDPVRRPAYECVSCLNRGHQLWAWCSLFWVGFSDLYVRMLAMGKWTDWRIF